MHLVTIVSLISGTAVFKLLTIIAKLLTQVMQRGKQLEEVELGLYILESNIAQKSKEQYSSIDISPLGNKKKIKLDTLYQLIRY